MNNVQLVGVIGNVKFQEANNNKKSFLNFSVAINKGKDQTDWIWLTAFDKTAEFINNNFVVGMTIEANGSLKVNTFTKEGQEQTRLGVVANSVGFVPGSKSKKMILDGKNGSSNTEAFQEDTMSHVEDIPKEHLPF
jgi:single-strand DNA-binding protein